MAAFLEWFRTEALTVIVLPAPLLFVILGALVLAALWLHTKTPSVHKVHSGIVVESMLDTINIRLLIAGAVCILAITPLWMVVARPSIGIPAVLWLCLVCEPRSECAAADRTLSARVRTTRSVAFGSAY